MNNIKGFDKILCFDSRDPDMQYAAIDVAQKNQESIARVARTVIQHIQDSSGLVDDLEILNKFIVSLKNIDYTFTENGFDHPFQQELKIIQSLFNKEKNKIIFKHHYESLINYESRQDDLTNTTFESLINRIAILGKFLSDFTTNTSPSDIAIEDMEKLFKGLHIIQRQLETAHVFHLIKENFDCFREKFRLTNEQSEKLFTYTLTYDLSMLKLNDVELKRKVRSILYNINTQNDAKKFNDIRIALEIFLDPKILYISPGEEMFVERAYQSAGGHGKLDYASTYELNSITSVQKTILDLFHARGDFNYVSSVLKDAEIIFQISAIEERFMELSQKEHFIDKYIDLDCITSIVRSIRHASIEEVLNPTKLKYNLIKKTELENSISKKNSSYTILKTIGIDKFDLDSTSILIYTLQNMSEKDIKESQTDPRVFNYLEKK